jgi:hypothetical protein
MRARFPFGAILLIGLIHPHVALAVAPTATITSVTPSPACVNENIVFKGTSNPACKTYSWNFGDGSPPVQGATATHAFSGPKTYTVTFKATNAAGETGTATVSVPVIGGPISKDDASAFWFCSSGDRPSAPNLRAATDQPANTTYFWAVTAGSDKLNLLSTTGTPVACQGLAASVASNDVTVTLLYQLQGKQCPATIQLTVATPKTMSLVAQVPPSFIAYPQNVGPNTINFYGFYGQVRQYLVKDQFGKAMPNVNVNEKWDNLNPATMNPIQAGNQITDANGQWPDRFAYQNYQPAGLVLRSPQSAPIGTMRQRLWVGSTGAGSGCLLVTYDQTQWRTNGVTNFVAAP